MKKVLSVILGVVFLVAAVTFSFKIIQIYNSHDDKIPLDVSISDESNIDDGQATPQSTTAEKTSPHSTATEKTSPHSTAAEKTSTKSTTVEKTSTKSTTAEKSSTKSTTAEKTSAKSTTVEKTSTQTTVIDKNGSFFSKDEVSIYIHTYGSLPGNFITKSQAQNLGWNSGSVEKYAPGKAIGGDIFYNREKQLPTTSGRTYYECDIDTLGASSRGAKRIVFSNDGLVYYTDNHYETFTLLYNGE